MMFLKTVLKPFIALIMLILFFPGYILGQDENIVQYTVFNAGEAGVNTFRIPVIVTTKEGTLIAACEARKESWRDKSPTDIAVKRSIDGGKTWSQIKFVTDGAKDNYAFMDP
ncbi:MAG: sialidase family protein, partial [Paludibacter sp.]|nr:sialidase family protein [Paludibacter sp.]